MMNGFRYLAAPRLLLALSSVVVLIAFTQLSSFRFDASSDTLVVEGDPDLLQFEQVVETFGGEDFLFLIFAPHSGEPFSPEALETLKLLVADLGKVEGVSNVFSVLDAPLLRSPPVELTSLLDGFPTLLSAGTDLDLAREELSSSPFFKELLVTKNGDATALKIDLAANADLIFAEQKLAAANASTQPQAKLELQVQKDLQRVRRGALIKDIRDVRARYQEHGVIHLGGVPMITADMISYVKNDLLTFGGVVVVLMIAALWLFFRRIRWVVLPLLTAAVSIAVTVGLLGFLGWQATVISSNFMSLLGITTISLTIHLIVHYRELRLTSPELSCAQIVYETMRAKLMPCLYTAITTIAAFGSLTVSGILPVADFGWMMCVGIVVSFFATFTVFPAVLLLLPLGEAAANLGNTNNFIRVLGEVCRWRPWLFTSLSGVIAIAAIYGISLVSLDNRFAEYFDEDTEIFQGMSYIDQNLGGTIPFDVILNYPPYEEDDAFGDEEDFFSEDTEDEYPERYWYSRGMLDRLEQVHRYLDAQPQVGKVLSLTALEDFAQEFTGGEKLGSLEIVAILGAVPEDLHRQIIQPYANPARGELRLSARIVESADSFDREEFRQSIVEFARTEAGFEQEEVVVTGMMVLFNGMLSKLLESQVNTLAYILLAVFIMFLVLLRSLGLALLGMIPNTLASATVIGAMGYTGVPLDMMTTTIAAVCIGIGVDDTIHYLHRFREEYQKRGDARIAVSFCHESIGRAMFYTSATVVVGFSALCFSSFVPTVMFGLWTAIAMVLALIANLTLLPSLLVLTHAKSAEEPQPRV